MLKWGSCELPGVRKKGSSGLHIPVFHFSGSAPSLGVTPSSLSSIALYETYVAGQRTLDV